MLQTVLHKRSAELNKVPSVDDIQHGEIAINYKKDSEAMYIKNDENEIVEFVSTKLLETYEFMLVDFVVNVSSGNVLTPMTSDVVPKAGQNNGVIDIPVKPEFLEKWAMCSLAKWEVFNGSQRVVAVPTFSFSMASGGVGQAALRAGFKTCGNTEVPFTKISGAVLYKRRIATN